MSFGWDAIELTHGDRFQLRSDVSITIYLADNCNPELYGRFFDARPMNQMKCRQISIVWCYRKFEI